MTPTPIAYIVIRMPNREWISIGATHILMKLQTHGERQEWHPVAQITLRQIYAATEPMYYAWKIPRMEEIGNSKTLEGALLEVELQEPGWSD